MPTFLTTDQVYRIIQRELPDGAYPDGPATAFFSTADSYATAGVIASVYGAASSIYDNYFPSFATDQPSGSPLPGQANFEKLYLGQQLDSSIPLQERRDKVIEKIRSVRRTTEQDILATVYSVINTNIFVEIVPWGCGCNGWVLDVSQLDISTVLNGFNGLEAVGIGPCAGPDAFGLSPEDFAIMEQEAYSYDVRIYGYTLTVDERSALESALDEAEPARSQHEILDGLDPNDMVGDAC